MPWMVIKVGEDPNIIGTNTSGVTRREYSLIILDPVTPTTRMWFRA